MAISQGKRTELHQELREKLTVDTADTLMDYLPPDGWSEVAMKSDLASLEVALKSDITSLEAAMKSDLALLRAEVKADIAELRTSTQSDIAELRTATQKDIAELKAATTSEFALIRSELQLLEARLVEKLNKTIINQSRWMIGILGSLVVAMIVSLVR